MNGYPVCLNGYRVYVHEYTYRVYVHEYTYINVCTYRLYTWIYRVYRYIYGVQIYI